MPLNGLGHRRASALQQIKRHRRHPTSSRRLQTWHLVLQYLLSRLAESEISVDWIKNLLDDTVTPDSSVHLSMSVWLGTSL